MPEDRVKVVVRIRPLSSSESAVDPSPCIQPVSESQLVLGGNRSFTFDRVFSMNSDQPRVYSDCVGDMVGAFFAGYNTTIFAYGQTGTGKTYTMGTGEGIRNSDCGMIPRVVEDLYARIEQKMAQAEADGTSVSFSIKVSYLEIHNEAVRDLLAPPKLDGRTKDTNNGINIRDDGEGGVVVMGVREFAVRNKADVMDLLDCGTAHRTIGATLMNATSSRSHSIFTLHMEQHVVVTASATAGHDTSDHNAPSSSYTVSKMHLVDLAGSERNKKTGATGERLKESITINSGLLALGNVISALGDTQRRTPLSHVPYRDSKLTRLLQDSLGGNSKTLMIACVSPSASSFEETLNTLRYANRARNIRNSPVVNRDPHSVLVAQLRSELQACRMLLLKYNVPPEEIPGFGTAAFSAPVETGSSQDVGLHRCQSVVASSNSLADGCPPPSSSSSAVHGPMAARGAQHHLRSSSCPGGARRVRQPTRTKLTDVTNNNATSKAGADGGDDNAVVSPTSVPNPLGDMGGGPAASSAREGSWWKQGPSEKDKAAATTSTSTPPEITPVPEAELEKKLLQAQLQSVHKDNRRLKDELFDAEWRTVQLTAQITQQNEQREKLEKELEHFKDIAASAAAATANPTVSSTEPVGPVSVILAAAAPSTNDDTEELQREISRLQTDMQKYEATLHQLVSEKSKVESWAQQVVEQQQREQDAVQQNLAQLAAKIKEKEDLISSLTHRDEKVEGVKRQFQRKIEGLEAEKMKLQAQDEARVKRLASEIAALKEHQEALKVKVRQHADRAGQLKQESSEKISLMRKQIAELEERNKVAEGSAQRKEKELYRLRAQLDKARCRIIATNNQIPAQVLKAIRPSSYVGSGPEGRTTPSSMDDPNVASSNRPKMQQQRVEQVRSRLALEEGKIATLLEERVGVMKQLDTLRDTRNQQDGVLSMGIQGLQKRIKILDANMAKKQMQLSKLQGSMGNESRVIETQVEIQSLVTEKQKFQEKLDQLVAFRSQGSFAFFQENDGAELQRLEDHLDTLNAAIEFGEQQVVMTKREIADLSKPDPVMNMTPHSTDSSLSPIFGPGGGPSPSYAGFIGTAPHSRPCSRNSEPAMGPTPSAFERQDEQPQQQLASDAVYQLKERLSVEQETVRKLERTIRMMELDHRRQLDAALAAASKPRFVSTV